MATPSDWSRFMRILLHIASMLLLIGLLCPAGHATDARRRAPDHGIFRGNAARDAVRTDPGPRPDGLLERAGLHADHAAVRFEPADRWVRIGHAVRHQRGECLSAAQHAVPPDD